MKNIWWHLLYIFLAYVGAWLILTLAAVDLMWWWPWGRFSAGVPPVDASARGTVIQAAVGWVGGVIGLGTFFLNRAQKQEHFKEEQQKDRQHFASQQGLERQHFSEQQALMRENFSDQQTLERQHFREDKDAQRQQFEQQTLEGRFVDIQNRLADKDNLLMRANAVIRLAEMAQTPWPGESDILLTENRFPFFPRAAAQLSAALHMEPEQPARDEIKNAIGRMVKFSKSGDQGLLYLLIAELMRANQSAVRAVHLVLSEQLRKNTTDDLSSEEIADLVDCRRFCLEDEANRLVWQELARGAERRASAGSFATSAADLRERASRLCDTRDALAEALRSLVAPANIPQDSDSRALQDWGREDGLNLMSAFLAGANLYDANLQGVNLDHARLNGAILFQAELQTAVLRSAHLQYAFLHRSRLQGTKLGNAHLEYAGLSQAELQGADFVNAKLRGTKLQGVVIHEGQDPPDFTGANWREANFSDYRGNLDKEVKGWFIEHYGTDGEQSEWDKPASGAE